MSNDIKLVIGETTNAGDRCYYASKYDPSGHEVETYYAPVSSVNNLAMIVNELSGKIASKFTNVSASSWVSSATYADYAYQCSISLTGVTSSDYCSVVFDVTEATSGNYAPVCTTYDGGVIIYSKVDTAITVPAIIKY